MDLRHTLSIFLAGFFLLLSSQPGAALDVPALKGRVNDYAGILSPSTERQLDAALKDLEQTDSTQIVVLTLPSLEGENLEAFSIRVAEQWQIGQKDLDNGALLLIAIKERKLRIEVGYGLEGSLTDLAAGRIIRNVIVPRFKQGRFDQGVTDGVAAMIGVVRGEFTPPQQTRRQPEGGGGFPRGLFALFAFVFLINMLGRLRRGLGAAAGAIIAPVVGAVFFQAGLIWLLLLIPLGLVAGFLLSLMGGPLVFGHGGGRIGYWGGGGGFSSGGGGFSGGGGGFGGGGASGGW